MKSARKLLFPLLSLLTLLPLAISWAGVEKYTDELREVLRFNNSEDTKQSVIIHLTDKVDIQTLDTRLYYQRVTRQYRHETVIRALQETAHRSQPAVKAVLDEMVADGRVEGYTAFWIFNGFVVYATPSAIAELSNLSAIDHVEMNFQTELIDPIRSESNPLDNDANTPPPGIVAINAPQVWYELGITGAGTLVGDLDTGAQGNHPALAARWRGNFAPVAECWRAPFSGSGTPTDGNGHGTHTLGTMCGATNGGTGDTTGVAPAALWIADDAIGGNTGAVFDNSVVDAYQWMADPDGNPSTVFDMPDVCNNSWGVYGAFAGYSDCDHRWDAAITALEAAGCVAEFSAGNEGSSAQTLRSPANVAFDSVSFFSTGAVDAGSGSFPWPAASFSSRGPSDCNTSFIKPEICAPGVNVYSSVPGSTYDGTYSGTSMAGPHVCGTVALMREANPDIDVRDIKSILIRTARDEGTAGKDNTFGWGFLDAYAAVQEVLARANYGRIIGTVRDANTLAPLTATVQIVGGSQLTVANGAGAYLLLVPADSSYTVRYSKIGYFSQDIPVVIVGQDTLTQDVNLVPRPLISMLNENFETGAPEWTHASAGGTWIDQWHISTERAFSGTQSYKCGDNSIGNYGNFNDARLVSPVINNLPEQAQLNFYYQIESEVSTAYPDSAYDGGILELSVNGGGFSRVNPAIGGYDKTFRYRSGGGNPAQGPMPGQPCWAGTITSWTLAQLDLSAYAGQSIQLRWRFGSDNNGVREGWYLDSVAVFGYGNEVVLTEIDSLVISSDGTDIFLDWPDDANPFYRVYSDTQSDGAFTTFEGSTATNNFTILNGVQAAPLRFYVVVAWDGLGNPLRSRPVRLEK